MLQFFNTDDYRLTACMNVLKKVSEMNSSEDPVESGILDSNHDDDDEQAVPFCTNPDCTKSRPNSSRPNRCVHSILQTPAMARSKQPLCLFYFAVCSCIRLPDCLVQNYIVIEN